MRKILMFMFFSLLLLSGCRAVILESSKPDKDIYIDGIADDWQGKLIYLEKQNISIGLMNDENFLYVCMIIGDTRIQNRIFHTGLELWFDDVHANRKKIGLRYPAGNKKQGYNNRNGSYNESVQLQVYSSTDNSEVEILNSDHQVVNCMPLTSLKGLELKMNNGSGRLVYELKLPLKKKDGYSVSLPVTKDSKFVMELVLKSTHSGSQVSHGGGGMKGGGMHGGGRRGNLSGMGNRSGSAIPQFSLNAEIKLAGF